MKVTVTMTYPSHLSFLLARCKEYPTAPSRSDCSSCLSKRSKKQWDRKTPSHLNTEITLSWMNIKVAVAYTSCTERPSAAARTSRRCAAGPLDEAVSCGDHMRASPVRVRITSAASVADFSEENNNHISIFLGFPRRFLHESVCLFWVFATSWCFCAVELLQVGNYYDNDLFQHDWYIDHFHSGYQLTQIFNRRHIECLVMHVSFSKLRHA